MAKRITKRKTSKKRRTKVKPSRIKKGKRKKPLKGKRKIAPIGIVTHFFPHVNAAVIRLAKPLVTGETIHIKGHTTNFKQTIKSMQIDRKTVLKARKGQEIGVEVKKRVRQHDQVFPAKAGFLDKLASGLDLF
jgi:hypothetical protein